MPSRASRPLSALPTSRASAPAGTESGATVRVTSRSVLGLDLVEAHGQPHVPGDRTPATNDGAHDVILVADAQRAVQIAEPVGPNGLAKAPSAVMVSSG